jgi:hypothetical protein
MSTAKLRALSSPTGILTAWAEEDRRATAKTAVIETALFIV